MPPNRPTAPAFLDPEVLARIANYPLIARNVVEGFLAGLHRSVFHGFGSEFVQYRDYVPGDDLKYADWKVYARSDELHMKVFQEETNANCYIVLDASASMAYAGQGLSKLHYGKLMAACLAYLVQRQGDNVSFYAYDESLRAAVPPGNRADQLRRICAELGRLEPQGQCDHERVLNYLGERFRRRGIVVMISDFLDAGETLFKTLRRFRFQHHDFVLFQLLDDDEVDFDFDGSVRFVDSETEAEITTSPVAVREQYREAFAGFLETLRRFATRDDVDCRQVRTSEPLAHVLAAYLHTRDRRR